MSILPLLEFVPSLFQGGSKMIEKLVQTVTGETSIEAAVQVLKSDPNKVIELQKLVAEKEAQIEMALLYDRQEARKREFMIRNSGRNNRRADVMLLLAVLGLAICLVVLGLSELRGEIVGIISTIAGIFGACLKDAYAFEFGSSRGSREKDQTLNELIGQL